MDEEHPSAARNDVARPGVGALLKASAADALGAVAESREVTRRPRPVVSAALLGTCVAFLIALVAAPRLDGPLTIAAVAFGGAIPFLLLDFIVASMDVRAGDARLPVCVVKSCAFAIYDALGGLGVGAGVVAALWHLSELAALALLGGLALALLAPPLVLVGLLLWVASRVREAQSGGRVLSDAEIEDILRKSRVVSLFVPGRARMPTANAAGARPPETPA